MSTGMWPIATSSQVRKSVRVLPVGAFVRSTAEIPRLATDPRLPRLARAGVKWGIENEHLHLQENLDTQLCIAAGNVLLSSGRLRLADFSEGMLFNETPLLQDQARSVNWPEGGSAHSIPVHAHVNHTHCTEVHSPSC